MSSETCIWHFFLRNTKDDVLSRSYKFYQIFFLLQFQAKLPKGIENVRPHLENIDNVPLLVPLFTDCTSQSETHRLFHINIRIYNTIKVRFICYVCVCSWMRDGAHHAGVRRGGVLSREQSEHQQQWNLLTKWHQVIHVFPNHLTWSKWLWADWNTT